MKSDLVRRICEIPQDSKIQNKSVFQLLKESGYFEQRNSVKNGNIIEFLNNHPKLLDSWELYSLDKRTSSGWYFYNDEENWIVGYNNFGRLEKERIFSSGIEACAIFIINEIKEIAA